MDNEYLNSQIEYHNDEYRKHLERHNLDLANNHYRIIIKLEELKEEVVVGDPDISG